MRLVADVDNQQYYLGDMSVRLARLTTVTMGRRLKCEELKMIMRLACCAIAKLEREAQEMVCEAVKVDRTPKIANEANT